MNLNRWGQLPANKQVLITLNYFFKRLDNLPHIDYFIQIKKFKPNSILIKNLNKIKGMVI